MAGSGGGHSITLNGHIDVCEDRLLEQWSNDPYDPVIDGRDLIGRGSSDMKSANASFMFAVQVLQRHGVQPEADVIVHSVMGEEAGSPARRALSSAAMVATSRSSASRARAATSSRASAS